MSKLIDSLKKLTKKSFYIELSTLDYPSYTEITNEIINYAKNNNNKLILNTNVMPIEFYLDNELYSSSVQMGRGSYYILCTKK